MLIGGASHAGKSTVTRLVAARFDLDQVSSDGLARHPGRPWRDHPSERVPAHVADHYRTLPLDSLMDSVLTHYRALWPVVRSLIQDRLDAPSRPGLIIEGSALLPESMAELTDSRVRAVWLISAPSLITARIRAESGYASRSPLDRALIDAFTARAIAFNAFLEGETSCRELHQIRLSPSMTPGEAADAIGAELLRAS